jgi:hypothetical protein
VSGSGSVSDEAVGGAPLGTPSTAVTPWPPPPPPTLANWNQPSIEDYITFLRVEAGIDPLYLPDDSLWITASYQIAMEKVSPLLQVAPIIYTLSVYNYATHVLVTAAQDQPGKTYFADLRARLGLNSQSPGMVQSSSDQGTSQSYLMPKWAQDMTLSGINMLKTPWGQAYVRYAQELGPVIWGLT